MSSTWVNCMLPMLAVTLSVVACDVAALTVGFYNQTCPTAEQVVRQAVADAFNNNSGVAAGLIRLHFHDCFVRGCEASVLLSSVPSGQAVERESRANAGSLRGFEVIDAAKAILEARCPNTVSCADILAFAARDSAALAGNISYQVPAGRRDGRNSSKDEADRNLPSPLSNAAELIGNFTAKNLTADDMVTLSGAHSIGVAHCASFTNRLYGRNGTILRENTLSSAYADLLRLRCPANIPANDTAVSALDIITNDTLDNKYYVGLNNKLGLLTSDQALVENATVAAMVNRNAANQSEWVEKFAQAMVKMGLIQVLEGTQGEIRKNCSVVNNASSTSFLIQVLRGIDIATS